MRGHLPGMHLLLRAIVVRSPLLLVVTMAGTSLRAQAAGAVEALAPVLAAEDARSWDDAAIRAGLSSPDSTVRTLTAMAVGRLHARQGVDLLVPLLVDRDSTVRVAAVFALGLLHDSLAVAPLADRLRNPPALDQPSALEAVTALSRTGGRTAADFLTAILQRRAPLAFANRDALIAQIALEAWRLGRLAPVAELLPLLSDTTDAIRYGAAYSLARLRPPSAGNRLVAAMQDESAPVRAFAVRALTRSYADSAGLAVATLADIAARAVDDPDAGVRVNALRSLATFRDPRFADRIAPRLGDAQPNVRVQAATTLGELGGPRAAAALAQVLAAREVYAVRSEALLALARVDSAAAAPFVAAWSASDDWRERAVAAQARIARHADPAAFLADRDSRVVASTLQAWSGNPGRPTAPMVAAARSLLVHRDAAVRSVAASILERAADVADIGALRTAVAASARDSFPDAAEAALGALAAIARTSDAARAQVDREALDHLPRPADYLVRRWAEGNWPAAARRWGPAYPIATGRTLEDYRNLARRYVFGPYTATHPHVVIEVADRGSVELELLGPDAPLTVANFLSLVDRHYFDGNRWHRVVPNFVVQDGDRRGDGWGGPGGAIRDEINRVRYDVPVLGMALSGPDTGSGQWFINLGPQPHLDGVYTVFGRVTGNIGPLFRITQGDLIRTIRR
jgi:cyclophilin family peptidyl-prolyl cis-trans isomerase/HEAT repeat protein